VTGCKRVKITEEIQMGQPERKSEEAAAVERVANAAREVQLASQAIEEKFNTDWTILTEHCRSHV
jgi:hypothetical protein